MKSLPDIIVEVCKDSHVPMVQAVFGDSGVEAVFQVMEAVKALYQYVDPERIGGQVVIFRVVASTNATPVPLPIGPAVDWAALANQAINDLVLEVAADGRSYHRTLDEAKPEDIALEAVVYRYQAGNEEFLASSQSKRVLRLDPSARSQFSVPTFSNLREALQCYARENIRESTCYVFKHVWYDNNRLFLNAGPEEKMRNSLLQFLRNRIGGDHDVWPEQIVDESHPVDIRVQPRFTNNRLMLIEIKWLGDSVAADGHITARHREDRAQKGANQLVQYLEEQRRFAPSHVIQGYYVIIDARRRNLREGATAISRADGMYFETEELTFKTQQVRQDFDPPYRMFARPVCSD